ncbi:MAG: outer membrane protein assembly factor BamA, partial [Desulfurobacteriaceae bacterium]
MKRIFFVFLILTFWWGAVLANEGKIIERVEIIGNQTVPKETILYYMSEKSGKEFSPKLVAKDIKTLFSLGYFENISVDVSEGKEGVILKVFVKEKPVITDIKFEGNKEFSERRLKEELGLIDEEGEDSEKQREPLSYKYLEDLKKKIKEFYEKKGFVGTKVDYRVEKKFSTKAVAVFTIVEGKKRNVCEIEIRGNKKIDDGDIKDVLLTKERCILCLRFSAPLIEENLKEDVERIKNLYYREGFLDVEVGEPKVVEIDKKKGCYKVIYTIKNEGEKYRFGKISFEGNTLFTSKELLKLSKAIRSGKTFNREFLGKFIAKITRKYGELGFIFASVIPEEKTNFKDHTVDIKFHIFEGERTYVRRINITGNISTRDRTIRRELDFYEKGIFDTVKVERSIRRLFNTGYFENVDVKPKVVDKNKVDVNVDVKERLTGMFSVGIGYSSVSKLVMMAQLSKGNLFGTGDSAAISFQGGSKVLYFDLSYNHKWWLDRPQNISYRLYNRKNEYFTYTSHKTGFSTMVSRRIWEDWRIGLGYLIERDKISDISEDAPDIIKSEEGITTVGMTTGFISRDLRDNRFLPHKGSYFSITTQVAGNFLGGKENFYKVVADYSKYFNL